jgi:hypothetical protein
MVKSKKEEPKVKKKVTKKPVDRTAKLLDKKDKEIESLKRTVQVKIQERDSYCAETGRMKERISNLEHQLRVIKEEIRIERAEHILLSNERFSKFATVGLENAELKSQLIDPKGNDASKCELIVVHGCFSHSPGDPSSWCKACMEQNNKK